MDKLIIKRPLITEKSLKDAASGIYTFEVKKTASKREIKDAVEQMFKVHVHLVTTTVNHGKTKLAGKKRLRIKEPDMKKARVKVSAGEKIEYFELGEQK